MNIFSAVRHSVDPSRFYGGLWSSNFHPALRALGHAVIESQTDLLPTSRFMEIADHFTPEELEARANTTSRILDQVRAAMSKGPVDLFLSYFYNSHFDPSGFDELRRLGVPSINFYCNSIYQFPLVAAVAAKADVSWHAERDAKPLYERAGARPVWVQMGADPQICRPVPDRTREPRACFVGQRYADRDRWAARVIGSGAPLDLYGAGWSSALPGEPGSADAEPTVYLGRRVVRAGSAEAYRRLAWDTLRSAGIMSGAVRTLRQWRYRTQSRRLTPLLNPAAKGRSRDFRDTFASYDVVLNFSNVWADGRAGSALIPHVRLRDFEAPMCRTCYLTGHTDEIGEFYDVGKEIDTYRTPDELVDKARYYLSHAEAAERLREAGFQRARRDHTWQRRFEDLFRKAGLTRSGHTPGPQ